MSERRGAIAPLQNSGVRVLARAVSAAIRRAEPADQAVGS